MPGSEQGQKAINIGAFQNLCSKMQIDSRRGPCPLIPMPTQLYAIGKIIDGLNRGIHQFVILKCRQSGITTITLAFLIYWMYRHKGMSGLFAIDDNDKKVAMNYIFRRMLHSLSPEDEEFYVPVDMETKPLVALRNGSKLHFDNANKREKGTLGRSIGLNLFHGSECAFWNDQAALMSLMASLDQIFPHRLYIFESTAKGFNLFHKMCEVAENSSTAEFIFIPWWMHHWYQVEENDALGIYRKYWDGQLNEDELEWCNEARARYGYIIKPGQIAWWRKMLEEDFMGNREALLQEYPPLPEHAFQYGGNVFFSAESLKRATIEINSPSNEYSPRYFRFKFGQGLTDIEVTECSGAGGYYHLAVWDAPRAGEGVMYAIGADPAWGMTEKSDYSSAQVFRSYADGMEQVAEFAMRGINTDQFAYAILVLFAAYNINPDVANVVWNIEVQGGGAAVITRIEQIQMDLGGVYDKLGPHFDNLRPYLYKRVDGLTRGYSAKHFMTTEKTKYHFLNLAKSMFESGELIIRSPALIREMSFMMRTPDATVESISGQHEDLVMSMGVAIMIYVDMIRFDIGDTEHTMQRGLEERKLLVRGASATDLIAMRIAPWVRERRNRQAEREEELKEIIQTEFPSDGSRWR